MQINCITVMAIEDDMIKLTSYISYTKILEWVGGIAKIKPGDSQALVAWKCAFLDLKSYANYTA